MAVKFIKEVQFADVMGTIRGLTLSHSKNHGANIAAEILTKVQDISTEGKVHLQIIQRGCRQWGNFQEDADEYDIAVGETINPLPNIEISLGDTRFRVDGYYWRAKVVYNVPQEYGISRVDYNITEIPWRPAFESDGIDYELFRTSPKKLLFQRMSRGTELGFAVLDEPDIGKDVACILAKGEYDFKVITRMAEGKIYIPPIENEGMSIYRNRIMRNLYCLANRHSLLELFVQMPLPREFWRDNGETIARIVDNARAIQDGRVSEESLGKLIWGYQTVNR